MKLVFVSSNEGKIKEAEEGLGIKLDFSRIKLEEIQSFDLSQIVQKKAEYAFKLLKKPLLVDDVGLFFDTLHGFPGPFIKYIEDIVGYPKLLEMLENETNRKVIVRSALGYHDGKVVHVFVGEVKGIFLREGLGDKGWGFDPYFLPNGQTETYGQMGATGKNKISHRAIAFKMLRKFLEQ